jgi:hypothetical protein
MEDAKPEEKNLDGASPLFGDEEQNNLQVKLAAADSAEAKADAAGSASGEKTDGAAAVKLLQTMSLWLEGASCPATDDNVLTGWSARYAEQFDQEEEVQIDLAPVLGLPEGTDREELARVAEEQEEDLLKQLIS